MTVSLPSASQTYAIVVGVERFVDLGNNFAAPGAVAGALAFANWLVHERHVPAAQVQLWLLPAGPPNATDRAQAANLAGCDVREFGGDAFWSSMSRPPAAFAGGFLCVYFCGHGVIHGPHNDQLLVLPESQKRQVACIDTVNWRELFRSEGWERFGYQLWVTDACRNSWGVAFKPIPRSWQPGAPQAVRRCAMFSCAAGETSAIRADGPLFTRTLLTQLRAAPSDDWPDFEAAVREAGRVLRAQADTPQSPAWALGEDWSGSSIYVPGRSQQPLGEVLSHLHWDSATFRPYLQSTLARSGITEPKQDLEEALAQMHDMPAVDGVPPLLDFAERIARAESLPVLREWIDERITPRQRAEIESRLRAGPCRLRLLLWWREDVQPSLLEAELNVIDASSGVLGWSRRPGRPVTMDTLISVIGYWLRAAHDAAGHQAADIVVELYLPRSMLADTRCDTATVDIDGDAIRLGRDHAALLHCTDRFKGPRKLKNWLAYGTQILARLSQPVASVTRWARPGEDNDALVGAFTAQETDAPVWLAFDPAACGGAQPLDTALIEGLPAVLWLRALPGASAAATWMAQLEVLLGGPLESLPQRLCEWRKNQSDPAARDVALMLDEPRRLPAILTRFAQPGG